MNRTATESGGAVASVAWIGLRRGCRGHAGADHAPDPDAKPHSTLTSLAVGALAALALSGCATTRYQRIYCLPHDQQLPAEPPKIHGSLTGNADKDLTIVAGSAIRLRAWGEGLQNIIEGCREPAH